MPVNNKYLKKMDSQIHKLIEQETKRQVEGLEMIPSENYVSRAVLDAMGSVLTNKYSEGYPGKRYYGGNEYIDQIENLAIERAKELFKVPYANVQPYSGSPANQAVCLALINPGDLIMGMSLYDGGHLTHGWKVSFSGIYYKSISYHVTTQGAVDFAEVIKLAKEFKPKLIWVGGSAYTKEYEFELFSKIADEIGAYLVADIAHVAGLVVAGVHKSPAPFAHVITTTTHKTLRGPRGAIIMVTKKGIKKDLQICQKIDKAVFPGLQGGPHNHTTAGVAVALKEASTDKFKKYGKQIVKNAKVLSKALKRHGFNLVGGITENHLILINLSSTNGVGSGYFAQEVLSVAGITVNKNTVPSEPSSSYYPSGIRLGTPALTSRGMAADEMEKIADFIYQALSTVQIKSLPQDKDERALFVKEFKSKISRNKELHKIRTEVKKLCKKFPIRI